MDDRITPILLFCPVSTWVAFLRRFANLFRTAGHIALPATLFFIVLLGPATVSALTDEIQVYDAEINKPGQWNIAWHNNFTAIGHKEPDFPGGIASQHTLNGVPEWAYGVKEWLELGLYLPVYSITGAGHLAFDGVKLRALFVVPHAEEKKFFYGVNFELSYNSPWWDTSRFGGEVRMIFGYRIGPVDLIVNPIFDTGFNGMSALAFVPAERVAYNFSEKWAAALEHYSNYGALRQLPSLSEQDHTLFAVVNYKGEPNGIEFGIGHGFTPAGDSLVFKLMLEHSF